MRVLVTGANGFIGQHVIPQLLESGHQVTACIRAHARIPELSKTCDSLKICRITSLHDQNALADALRGTDAVIHLAGRAHVMHETAANPVAEFQQANVAGTESVVRLAAEMGTVQRFIFLSSIMVNGEATTKEPFRADDPPAYRGIYAESKWEAEERLRQIATTSGMEWVIVRPPLVYGPCVRGNFLTLLRSVARGIPLPLASLDNRRSMIGVHNLSDFLVQTVTHPGAANNRFVAADREDLSTPGLVRSIAKALGRPPRLLPCPEFVLKTGGALFRKPKAVRRLVSSLVVDRRKAMELLGWTAPASLEWELRRTAEWYFRSTVQ